MTMTRDEKIIAFVKHLQDVTDKKQSVTWTDLDCIIDIVKDKFLPSDCESDIMGKCLSEVSHLCKHCVNGECTNN